MRNTATTRRLGAILLSLALAATLGACATNQSASTQVDDGVITTKVKAKLAADPEINPFNIDVDTDNGVVRLSGTVEKPSTRVEAEQLARNTDGVRGVENDLKIGKRTMGERLDDTAIVTKINAKYTADPQLNPFNIDVDSKEGVVTLSGKVKSDEHRREAEKLARDTKGVKRVINELEIRG